MIMYNSFTINKRINRHNNIPRWCKWCYEIRVCSLVGSFKRFFMQKTVKSSVCNTGYCPMLSFHMDIWLLHGWKRHVAVNMVSSAVCVVICSVNDEVCTEDLRHVGMSVMVVVVKVRLLSGLQDWACFALAFNSSVPSICDCEAVRASSVISRGVCLATI